MFKSRKMHRMHIIRYTVADKGKFSLEILVTFVKLFYHIDNNHLSCVIQWISIIWNISGLAFFHSIKRLFLLCELYNLYKNRAVVFTNRRGMQNISSAFTKRWQGREIYFVRKCHVANKIILRYNIVTEKSSLLVPAPCAVPFAVFCIHHLSQLSDTVPQLIEDN